ncbi:MFS transporter [Leuconostoc mesenteroides]|uniref:MFS transporter n=1 Tax=Leuconostoc mesenteroides TaxID=1245 RepID=UPI0021A72DDD|nr:MFS transporter [Leuconostoc mesenteroides]MCT3053147.1 MFS transporter [Leuconostoc mesenteroides]
MMQNNQQSLDKVKGAVSTQSRDTDQRLFTKDFIILMMINFLVVTAVTTQMGTLPLYVTHLGGNSIMSGLVVGIWGLAALCARIPVGKLLDTYGRKKLIFIGLAILMADFSMLIFYSTIASLIVLRALQGIGNGTQSTSVATMVADKLPKQKLSIGLGYFSISQTLPAAIGPAIGLVVVENFGFQSLFYFSLSLICLAFVLSFFVKDNYTHVEKSKHVADENTGFLDLIRLKSVWVPSLIVFVVCFANAAVTAFLVQFGEQKNLSATIVGFSFTMQAIIGALVRVWFAKLYLYFRSYVLVIAGILMIASAYFMIAFGATVEWLVLAGALNGFGFALLIPLMNAVVLKNVSSAQRGRATAIFSSGTDVAYGLGAFMWGVVANFIGFFGMYCLTATMVIATLLLVIAHNRLLNE